MGLMTAFLIVAQAAIMQSYVTDVSFVSGDGEVTHAAASEEPSVSSESGDAAFESSLFSVNSFTGPLQENGELASPVFESSQSSDFSVSSVFLPQRPDAYVGVYLTAGSTGREEMLLRTMEDSGKAGANAIVFDVKSDRVLYETDAAMARHLGLVSAKFNVQSLLKVAKERGFYTIARFVAISDAGFTDSQPQTQLKDPKSGTVITPGYIDPANPEALQYNAELICELAKIGVSEINLDYIRFSTSNNPATSVYSPVEKANRVEAFVRMVRETIDRCGPDTKLGISTFAILGWNYPVNVAVLGQDFVRFAPLVDVISPMAYPSMFTADAYYDPTNAPHTRMYTLVYKTMIGYRELLGPTESLKLRPWLQGYGITQKNMSDQIEGATDAGGCGFMVWNADNYYGPVYKAMSAWEKPARCF
jgi:hypothetical protein